MEHVGYMDTRHTVPKAGSQQANIQHTASQHSMHLHISRYKIQS